MGHMGMIDYYRLPLNTWYWYRENLLGIQRPAILQEGIPFRIHLAADRTKISSDGTQDAHIIVSVDVYKRQGGIPRSASFYE